MSSFSSGNVSGNVIHDESGFGKERVLTFSYHDQVIISVYA